MEAPSMTEDEVRAAAERLVRFHERFAPLLSFAWGIETLAFRRRL
jgi:hypothetical protein